MTFTPAELDDLLAKLAELAPRNPYAALFHARIRMAEDPHAEADAIRTELDPIITVITNITNIVRTVGDGLTAAGIPSVTAPNPLPLPVNTLDPVDP